MNQNVLAPLKKYLSLTRTSILEGLNFRAGYLLSFVGNIVYFVVIYNLWRAIYDSSPTAVVNGMTFTDTMIYLVLAAAQFSFMEAFIVWDMGRSIQSGKIILDIIKPMKFQTYMFFYYLGGYILSFFATFLPSFIIVYCISNGRIVLGVNLLFFVVSVIMGILINFAIDFLVSAICLYTLSPYGINIMKEVIVLLLSGATVPLAFFPEPLKTIVEYLPFQAIYNTPLKLLIHNNLPINDIIKMFIVQLFWAVVTLVACNLFWNKSLKIITVNGG